MAVVSNPIVVMKRYEMKYILNPQQTEYFKKSVEGHMKIDKFGLTSIASLYYDTPNYRLIRTSVEKPPFKEKIRLRSYGLATDSSPVFLELKRKAYGIVYKRRVQSTIPLVKKFFDGEGDICAGGQINREITTFRDYYQTLVPACMIIYDRIAYFEPDGDLRLTIDHNPRYRYDQLDLTKSMKGNSLLKEGYTILEVKVQQAVPLWLSEILTKGEIYKGSFSKYGEAYRQQLLKVK
ncbi:MAG: polyphosphate polymerase domain-containing protein [Clostridia bacterium]|nr:polyphosphate polymerase domain-containing protein [Clostridia bacterium]MBR2176750.1 polyphosphate polymerase domain-containing protein [Clostridia bacterium]